MTSTQVGKIFIYAGGTVLTGFVGVLLFWLGASGEVLSVRNNPVPVRPSEVKGQDAVSIATVDYCKYQDVQGVVNLTLISDKAVLLIPQTLDRSPKGCGKIDAPLLIPPQAGADTYHWHWKIVYQVNPLRVVTEEFDSQEFKLTGEQ